VDKDARDLFESNPDATKMMSVLRTHVRESFGKVPIAMMGLPRYQAESLLDLRHLVLDPIIRDRAANALPMDAEGALQQFKSRTRHTRLKPDDWACGKFNWPLDVIAKGQKTIVSLLGKFNHMFDGGDLRLHSIVSRLVDQRVSKNYRRRFSSCPRIYGIQVN